MAPATRHFSYGRPPISPVTPGPGAMKGASGFPVTRGSAPDEVITPWGPGPAVMVPERLSFFTPLDENWGRIKNFNWIVVHRRNIG